MILKLRPGLIIGQQNNVVRNNYLCFGDVKGYSLVKVTNAFLLVATKIQICSCRSCFWLKNAFNSRASKTQARQLRSMNSHKNI